MIDRVTALGVRAWPFFLLTLNALYLAYELAFNSRIVDSATGQFDIERIDALEIQGRVLSSIGLTLLLWRLLPRGGVRLSKFLALAAGMVLVSFSLMFWGQKVLVEHLVDQADGEERLNAQYLSVLKRGLAVNAIQLDDISIPDDQLDAPGTRALINILPAMIYSSDAFVDHIKTHTDTIIDKLAQKESLNGLPGAYTRYTSLSEDVSAQYQRYLGASDRYDQALAEALIASTTQVSQLYIELGNNWRASQNSLSREDRVRKSLEIKRRIADYFSGKAKCQEHPKFEQRCLIKLEQVYRDKVTAEAGRYVAPDYWCYPSREQFVTKTIRGQRRVVVEQVQDCQTMTREYLEEKLLSLVGGGGTFNSFLQSADVRRQVYERLVAEGVEMPTGWQLNDRPALEKAVRGQAKARVVADYRAAISNTAGFYIPPGLAADQFVLLPQIQNQLRQSLDVDESTEVALNWSPDKFHQVVLKPHYVAEYHARKAALLSKSDELADGGQRETQGRQYYRSIIVPPIAMGFSLFFGLLNLFALGSAALSLTKLPSLAGKGLVYGVGAVLFFILPTAMPSDVVTSNAFGYFKRQMDASLPPLASTAAAWAVDTQPILYPLGTTLAALVGQYALEEQLINWTQTKHVQAEVVTPPATPSISELGQPSVTPAANAETATTVTADNPAGERLVRLGRRGLPVNSKAFPFSLEGVNQSLTNGAGLMVDLIPLGRGGDEGYVIYDKPVVGQDVCIRGRRTRDSLYHLKQSDWLAATHGACNTSLTEVTHLPSLERYLAAIKRQVQPGQKVIYTLHAPLTDGVYCNKVHALVDKARSAAARGDTRFNTTSAKVLACLQTYPHTIEFGFQFPPFEAGGQWMETVNHSVLSRKEWQRVNDAETGLQHGVDAIPVERLNSLLQRYGNMRFAVLDQQHLTDALTSLARQQHITLVTYDAMSLAWPTDND